MRTQLYKIAQAAALGFAITFTLSCSGGDDPPGGEDGSSSSIAAEPSSSGDSSSSSFLAGISSSGGSGISSGSACTASDNNGTHYCSGGAMKQYGSVTDDGGKTYRTVEIGTQTWMAENLNHAASGSKCYAEGVSGVSADSSSKNCAAYGRLYNWATALAIDTSCNASTVANCGATVAAKHKGVCPSGWHIPDDADWDALMTAVGGSSTAGTKLKSTSGWRNGGNGTDEHGFAALPGGRGYPGGVFDHVGYLGNWWSSTEDDAAYAYYRYMGDSAYVSRYSFDKTPLRSVRCLQD